jgi:hypothetical protein
MAFAGVVLAQAGVTGWPSGISGLLAPAVRVIAGFVVLDTLGNLAYRSRFRADRLGGHDGRPGGLCGFVALTA